MSTPLLIGLAVLAVVAALVVYWLISRQSRRRAELREHFGPEYERTVHEYGAERDADKVLMERKERVEHLQIRPLSPEQSARYAATWRSLQAQFVDDPEQAIVEADRVLIEVMQRRGYPMVDFEQRAADVSVDHPEVVEHYRAAHQLAGRAVRGEASTEDMRQAFVHYRYLFDDLIEDREHAEVLK